MTSCNKGKDNPMYGRTHSLESRLRISAAHKDEKNVNWKGDNVGINPLHIWAKKRLPKPELCPTCNKKPIYDLSNISGNYLRDLSDWEYLCRSCHMIKDYKNGIRIPRGVNR